MPSRSKILIIDDDDSIRETLTGYLETQGFSVANAKRQKHALALVESFSPDIIILDIAIADGGGLSVFLKIRQFSQTPVIFLANETEEADCIISLEIGGDDYITLPCNPRELCARVKAVLRRVGQISAPSERPLVEEAIKFHDFTYNPRSYKLTDPAGRVIRLSRNERKLLVAFLANPNIVLSREKLLEKIKNRPKDIFDRSIDNLVSRLRKKLELNSQSPRLIKTYWGGGYSLSADVTPH